MKLPLNVRMKVSASQRDKARTQRRSRDRNFLTEQYTMMHRTNRHHCTLLTKRHAIIQLMVSVLSEVRHLRHFSFSLDVRTPL
jgi:protein gp37